MVALAVVAATGMLCFLTSFTDPAKWSAVKSQMQSGEFGPTLGLSYQEDVRYANKPLSELSAVARDIGNPDEGPYYVVADARTMQDGSVVIVNRDDNDDSFRCDAEHAWSPISNLPIGNMDFAEFKKYLDAGGVFRGFPDPEPEGGEAGTAPYNPPPPAPENPPPANTEDPTAGQHGGAWSILTTTKEMAYRWLKTANSGNH